jgi:predicted MFS family arabinose efflux permease
MFGNRNTPRDIGDVVAAAVPDNRARGLADREGQACARTGRNLYMFPLNISIALRVFVPFAAGYLLSYLFRTINGPLAERMIAEFRWDAGTLGLLTSVYFLTFAAFALPLGVLLDRFGPRRVQAVLTVVAAGGATMFAVGHELTTLILGRAMIGLGTSGALMAGLKALNLWVPKPRLAAVNGLYVMCGGLGAMASTTPIGWLIQAIGWRYTFLVLASATLLVALAIQLAVPERRSDARLEPWRAVLTGLWDVYGTAAFWRFAPLSAMTIGTAFGVHGLWAARWMADVDGMAPPDVTTDLLAMGAGLTVGAAALGLIAGWLRSRGVMSASLFAVASALFQLTQALILARISIPVWLIWSCFALFGGMTVLSYSMLAELFDQNVIGRANGALNVLHLGMAFVIQFLIGVVTDLWRPDSHGQYPAGAYQSALAVPLLLQVLALAWFLFAPRVHERYGAVIRPVGGPEASQCQGSR